MKDLSAGPEHGASPCTSCGACCATSSEWPRFSLETEFEISRISADLVSETLGGMRCTAERCDALDGVVGVETRCTIYSIRPIVCRTCQPGDEECHFARRTHGLSELSDSSVSNAGRLD